MRKIGERALRDVFGKLRSSEIGDHGLDRRGFGQSLGDIEEEPRENPSWLAAMMINLNRFELETQSIQKFRSGLCILCCIV